MCEISPSRMDFAESSSFDGGAKRQKLEKSFIPEIDWRNLYTALLVPLEELPVHFLDSFVENIFMTSGMLPKDTSPETLHNFVVSIRCHYNLNRYHTFVHAVHVLLNCRKVLDDIIIRNGNSFPREEGLALLFAALVHDVGHLGVVNSTLVDESHDLAIVYSDQNVAERHSLAKAFQILKLPDHNIIEGFSKQERLVFRKIVIDLVLSTDIVDQARQIQLQTKYNEISRSSANSKNGGVASSSSGSKVDSNHNSDLPNGVTNYSNNRRHIDLSEQANRIAFLTLVIRFADIGGTMQNIETSKVWSHRLFMEKEDAYRAGRGPDQSIDNFYDMQTAFIDHHATEMAAAMEESGLLSVKLMDDIKSAIELNSKEWRINGKHIVNSWVSTTSQIILPERNDPLSTSKSSHTEKK